MPERNFGSLRSLIGRLVFTAAVTIGGGDVLSQTVFAKNQPPPAKELLENSHLDNARTPQPVPTATKTITPTATRYLQNSTPLPPSVGNFTSSNRGDLPYTTEAGLAGWSFLGLYGFFRFRKKLIDLIKDFN